MVELVPSHDRPRDNVGGDGVARYQDQCRAEYEWLPTTAYQIVYPLLTGKSGNGAYLYRHRTLNCAAIYIAELISFVDALPF